MDLFEYQARDMFEKHGVPVLAGAVAETPEPRPVRGGEDRRHQWRRDRRQGAGQDRWPRQGRRRQGRQDRRRGGRRRRARSSAWTSRATRSHQVMIAQGAQIAEEYYFSVLLDRANRTYLAMASKEGGMEIEAARRRAARGPRPRRGRPDRRHRRGQGREIVDAAGFADDVTDQVADVIQKLWIVYRDEDATLVEVNPLVKTDRRPDRRPRRQGHPRRERRLPPPRARGARGQGRGRPARGGGQGQGPQLRQARRRGRHHRQRRGSGHEHPGRRRLRRRGVRRRQAGQLPRHRRWRLGRGDGQRPATSSSATRR